MVIFVFILTKLLFIIMSSRYLLCLQRLYYCLILFNQKCVMILYTFVHEVYKTRTYIIIDIYELNFVIDFFSIVQ